jgi:hypothetical protein
MTMIQAMDQLLNVCDKLVGAGLGWKQDLVTLRISRECLRECVVATGTFATLEADLGPGLYRYMGFRLDVEEMEPIAVHREVCFLRRALREKTGGSPLHGEERICFLNSLQGDT